MSAAGRLPLWGFVKPPAKPVVMIVRAGEENERAALELAAEGVGICRFVHGGMEDGLRGARGMAGEGSAWILWVYGRGGLTMGEGAV